MISIDESKQTIIHLLDASGLFNVVDVEFDGWTFYINGQETCIIFENETWTVEFYYMQSQGYMEPPEMVERPLGEFDTLYEACVKICEQIVEDRMFCAQESKSLLNEYLENTG